MTANSCWHTSAMYKCAKLTSGRCLRGGVGLLCYEFKMYVYAKNSYFLLIQQIHIFPCYDHRNVNLPEKLKLHQKTLWRTIQERLKKREKSLCIPLKSHLYQLWENKSTKWIEFLEKEFKHMEKFRALTSNHSTVKVQESQRPVTRITGKTLESW